MREPCCHVPTDEVVRTETATPSRSRGHLAKGGFVGVVGQLGLLGGASVPTSDVGLLKSNFRYPPYENRRRAHLLQRYRNRISGSKTAIRSPHRGHLANGGSWVLWGSWGCFGVLWFGPQTHERRRVTEIKFRYPPYEIRKRACVIQRPRNRISGHQIARLGVRGGSTCETLP